MAPRNASIESRRGSASSGGNPREKLLDLMNNMALLEAPQVWQDVLTITNRSRPQASTMASAMASVTTSQSQHRPSQAPRASEGSLSRLPKVRVLPHDRHNYKDDNRQCGVCCTRLVDGVVITRLPCGHLYHLTCIIPWFDRACTCPECRYELETHDEAYEVGRQERMKERTTVSCTCSSAGHHMCFFDRKMLVTSGKKAGRKVATKYCVAVQQPPK